MYNCSNDSCSSISSKFLTLAYAGIEQLSGKFAVRIPVCDECIPDGDEETIFVGLERTSIYNIREAQIKDTFESEREFFEREVESLVKENH